MAEQAPPVERPLEERLRDMILSNVTIGQSPAPTHSHQPDFQRHRGGHMFFANARYGPFDDQNHPSNYPPGLTRGPGNYNNSSTQSYSPDHESLRASHFHRRPRGGAAHHQHSFSTPGPVIHPDEFARQPHYGSPRRGGGRGGYHPHHHSPHHSYGHHPAGNPPFQQANLPHHNSPMYPQRAPPAVNAQTALLRQSFYLESLAVKEISNAEMAEEELTEKKAFRANLESVLGESLSVNNSTKHLRLVLKPFGSFSSGFATKGSDMDLAILLYETGSVDPIRSDDQEIPRILEKCLLEHGFGARLLTKTRVPILKICEKPTPELLAALKESRQKWDELPEEEKYPSPEQTVPLPDKPVMSEDSKPAIDAIPPLHPEPLAPSDSASPRTAKPSWKDFRGPKKSPALPNDAVSSKDGDVNSGVPRMTPEAPGAPNSPKRAWTREKKRGPLDFPSSGVGIQCDINFSTRLGLYNTHLLYCYALCDSRVRPMVLFVKAWAKRRKINSPYHGTLSSYGYVLMVLHFLANVANPPVVPNLQLPSLQSKWSPPQNESEGTGLSGNHTVDGYDVCFWNNEEEISRLALEGMLSQNRDELGKLLRNFFQYYANTMSGYTGSGYRVGFQWTQEVLSLRTVGGILTKNAKGWTGANTTVVAGKEVRNRYLFAIEDPFETDHNVARTVTHNGIIAIRDEFRRAWRILGAVGQGNTPEDDLFAIVEDPPEVTKAAGTADADGNGEQGAPGHSLPTAAAVAGTNSFTQVGSNSKSEVTS